MILDRDLLIIGYSTLGVVSVALMVGLVTVMVKNRSLRSQVKRWVWLCHCQYRSQQIKALRLQLHLSIYNLEWVIHFTAKNESL